MFETTIVPFDLQLTADSGQCFRMRMVSPDTCMVVAQDQYVQITTLGDNRFRFACDEAQYLRTWAHFFDTDTDYLSLRALPGDAYAERALHYARGVRILRQHPWEALISFILSQRRNIPAIRHCVEQLCRHFGRPLGSGLFAFPTPQALAGASMEELRACSLGYRAPYIAKTAQMVASGAVDLDALSVLPDDQLDATLRTLPGVGVKVSACVMLFGYHRLNAFPVDVWMERVIHSEYNGAFPLEAYAPYAGIFQQYLFVYARHLAQKQAAV